jgi:hypothetical protein
VPLGPPDPAHDRKIGDARLARGRDPGAVGQPLVQHAVKPLGLVAIARQAELARRALGLQQELVHLAGHRAEATHLPHQPLGDRNLLARIRAGEPAGLGGEIEQDRPAFEHADGRAIGAVGIDDGGDLVVRADGEERRLELLLLGDVHDMHPVGQAHLLQRHADLAAVRRVVGVEVDHVARVPVG